jgi:hypothetical protein
MHEVLLDDLHHFTRVDGLLARSAGVRGACRRCRPGAEAPPWSLEWVPRSRHYPFRAGFPQQVLLLPQVGSAYPYGDGVPDAFPGYEPCMRPVPETVDALR